MVTGLLTVPGIETKRNFKSKFTDQTNIIECIEFYRLVFVQGGRGSRAPMETILKATILNFMDTILKAIDWTERGGL